jgi:D-alanine-D-alanine ligase
MKTAILFGKTQDGASADEADTLHEVAAVRSALESLGASVAEIPLSLDLAAAAGTLRDLAPEVAFNLVESVEGRGRLIHLGPSLLEHLGIPYTGAPLEAVFLTSNKLVAKRLLAADGIPTPPWTVVDAAASFAGPGFQGPYIVKSVWEHASIGLDDGAVAADAGALAASVAARPPEAFPLFVERFVDGRELNIALLGGTGFSEPEVLPPAEIVFRDFPAGKPRIVGYRAKWDEESFESRHTVRSLRFPPSDDALLRKLSAWSLRCWRLFGLRGYARVDFRVDAEGRPHVLEVNVNPCISPDAGFRAAAGAKGLDAVQVVRRILADVPGRKGDYGFRRQ